MKKILLSYYLMRMRINLITNISSCNSILNTMLYDLFICGFCHILLLCTILDLFPPSSLSLMGWFITFSFTFFFLSFFIFLFFFFSFFAMLANQFGDVTTRFHFTTSFVLCAHMCTPSIPCGMSLLMQILVSLDSKTFSLCNFQ